MNKTSFVVLGMLLLGLVANGSQAGQNEKNASSGRVLKVRLQYTGSGAVDEKHKIFVFLFDSPAFTQGQAAPIASQAATAKDETVTFSEFTASPVYVAVIFDPSGNFDGQSRPPSGSSLGMYSKTPGVPEPVTVEPGKTVEVEITFNDDHKMQ